MGLVFTLCFTRQIVCCRYVCHSLLGFYFWLIPHLYHSVTMRRSQQFLGCASGWVLGSSWCRGGHNTEKDQQGPSNVAGSPSSADGVLSLLCRIFVDAIGGSGGKYSNDSEIQFEPERLLSSFPFMMLPQI